MPSDARLPLTSLSPDADRLAGLKLLFPEAFTEDKVDFERLKQALGGAIQTDRERYGLTWAGKSSAIHVLQSLSVGTLKPDREASVNFDTTENLIIEGDNLEVLKLLQKSYFGKVKMIYIDPPYNTGNEFIYPDNFREGLAEYLRYSGQTSEEGTATTSNKDTDGRFHSKWLSMMYPRIFLAKNLLREDGVIFVSIDDHEVHNLRLMMNEIFGEENFIASIAWEKRSGPPNDKTIGEVHEYIIVYAKSSASIHLALLPRSDEDKSRFTNSDHDPRGPWVAGDLSANAKGGRFVQSLYYEIVNPVTGQKHLPPQGACWRFSRDRVEELIKDGRIFFGSENLGRPKTKRYLNEVRDGLTIPTIWKNFATNAHARDEIFSLFQDNSAFETPKPKKLIKRMVEIGTEGEDIVLDFFAGSGTTAQAVLEVNEEDGGNRKFILVQLPEETGNTQFSTIADITRERVRRVIQRMDQADDGKLPLESGHAPDRGFKALRLAASNFKIWEGAEGKDGDAIAAQLELFADNLLPGATTEDILFEILLKAGYDLNVPCNEISIAGHRVYSVADGLHLICLERDITREAVDAIIKLNPVGVICLDKAFHGDDALLTNTLLQMQDAEIIFQTI